MLTKHFFFSPELLSWLPLKANEENKKSKANSRIIVYFKHIVELDNPCMVQGLVDIVFPQRMPVTQTIQIPLHAAFKVQLIQAQIKQTQEA